MFLPVRFDLSAYEIALDWLAETWKLDFYYALAGLCPSGFAHIFLRLS